jgi:hypothetical protein
MVRAVVFARKNEAVAFLSGIRDAKGKVASSFLLAKTAYA